LQWNGFYQNLEGEANYSLEQLVNLVEGGQGWTLFLVWMTV